ncbi:MAG: Nif3-like dinuclear metal center hexameric protein [Planctomycetota bacterium]
MKCAKLIKYLNAFLRVSEIEDDSKNGLQVEGADEVAHVAFAVDACQAAFEQAVSKRTQLLIVHHGIFWNHSLTLTGPHYRRMKTLIQGNVGLYGAHLPLDAHPTVGNNAELIRVLGLKKRRPFGKYHKSVIGFAGELPHAVPLNLLVERLQRVTGLPPVRVLAFGPKRVRTVGCISGGAAEMLDQAHTAGFDLYVTGETQHRAFHDAQERRMNVIFGGHYATEVLGLKALARHVEKKFQLKTTFLDLPTGT